MTANPGPLPPVQPEVSMTVIDPDQWQRLRTVRLASLRESPQMFGSSHAREVVFEKAEWRSRARAATTFVASRQGSDVGLATFVVVDGTATLTGVWVDPAHRGQGIVDRLCESVATQARRAGYERVCLEVVVSNLRGINAYRRCGYEFDGRREVLPDGRMEVGMVRELGRTDSDSLSSQGDPDPDAALHRSSTQRR